MYFNTLKVLFFIVFYSLAGFSQNFSVNKIEPPNWWAGMKWDTVQLMVYGANLNGVNVRSVDDNLKILTYQSTENGSNFFVDVCISNEIEPRDYELVFFNDDMEKEIFYPILSRETSATEHQGFSNEDVIYLIFADRFCDGNSSNNTIGDSLDQFTSADLDGRKGGVKATTCEGWGFVGRGEGIVALAVVTLERP